MARAARAGSAGRGDRPADHQEVGAVLECLRRRDDPLLVAGIAPVRVAARDHQQRVGPEGVAQGSTHSCAEQTRPSMPRSTASVRRGAAPAPAGRSAPQAPRTASSSRSRLVSTVIARSRVGPARAAAAAAAASIAGPPQPCTVRKLAPSRAAERTAPATVFGMSCSFRSRKRQPTLGHSPHAGRALGGEEFETQLQAAHLAHKRTGEFLPHPRGRGGRWRRDGDRLGRTRQG